MRQHIKNRVAELIAIKSRREGRSIRKTTIAEETGLNRGTIDTWLANDVTRYDADVMLVWCNYLDCGVADLFVVEEIASPETQTTPVGYLMMA